MGSPSFGTMPGNNAPMPVFGGTNPTGMNYGSPSGGLNSSFPNYPMFGGSPSGTGGYITPTANMGIYGSPSSGIQGLSSGNGLPYGGNDFGLMGELDSAYGEGVGHSIDSILTQGLFNPQVAAAYMNAMQPSYNRGVASLETAFGAEGSRFGSAAALGIGDFSSQFSLNEQQTMATMYMQAQQEQLQLLEGILPTMHAEAANGGIWGDVLGGLEAVGGVVAAPFTGGMSLGLTAAGIGQIIGANSGGSSGGGFSGPMTSLSNPFGISGFGGGSGSYGPYNGGSASTNDALNWQIVSEQQQAGAALGGTDSSSFAPWMVGGGYN